MKEDKWRAMKEAWMKNAQEVCGWTKGKRKHRETWWWNSEVAEAVKKKQELFRKWKTKRDTQSHKEYIEAKRSAKRIVWRAKEGKCQEFAVELNSENGKKNFFKIA